MNKHVEELIKHLEGQRKDLERKLKIAYTLRDADQLAHATATAGSGNKKAAGKTNRGAGFVSLILPFLQAQGALHSDELFKELKKKLGKGTQVSRASFDSTLASEVKKAKPRIRRVTPGVYAAIEQANGKAPQTSFDFPTTTEEATQ